MDSKLDRRVWLVRQDSVASSRKEVARGTRNRWLRELKVTDDTWQVFEAIQGRPLRTVLKSEEQTHWNAMRHWLHDIASELATSGAEGILPQSLSLDYIWIKADGRAVLLDSPWPVQPPAPPVATDTVAGQQRFLTEIVNRIDTISIPIHAHPLLRQLASNDITSKQLAKRLEAILAQTVQVERGRRLIASLALPFVALSVVLVTSVVPLVWQSALKLAFGRLDDVRLVATVVGMFGVMLPLTQLVSIILFGASPNHALLHIAPVNAKGAPAGRIRQTFCWIIAWIPWFGIGLAWDGVMGTGIAWPLLTTAILSLWWLIGLFFLIVFPSRGIPEFLTGIWLVRQ